MIINYYLLKEPRTNEVRYVGCTRNMKERYKNHLNKCRDIGTEKRKWINELRELKLKPILEIIEIVEFNDEHTDYLIKEKEYILKYRQLGYNLTNTGDETNNGNITSFKEDNGSKSIVALNLDGSFYNRFPSISKASIDLNVSDNPICVVLKKKGKTAHSFIWLYEDEYNDLSEKDIKIIVENALDRSNVGGKETRFGMGKEPWNKGKTFTRKPILQLDLDGNIIREFKSCSEASKTLKCSPKNIKNVCLGLKKTVKNFNWKYK